MADLNSTPNPELILRKIEDLVDKDVQKISVQPDPKKVAGVEE